MFLLLDREIGIVHNIIYENSEYQEIEAIIGREKSKAISYTCFTGICRVGDKVLLNTTAIRLGLGTGGFHYVIAILKEDSKIHKKTGHIMKLRYTPLQLAIQTMEEEESPYHDSIMEFKSLENLPVISCSLHSMLAPAVAIIKYYLPDIKITYIMTDGGSLPISMSNIIRHLKDKKLIDNTITYGHAFGGDFEAINIYTALIGAKEVCKADLVIVGMGPGIVGSGTKYGFTGLEQGSIIDAINTLGGYSLAIPRISFADKRKRHYGISHHTITTFTKVAKTKTTIVFPEIKDKGKMDIIREQIIKYKLSDFHNIEYKEVDELEKVLKYFDIRVSTMGRNYIEDKEFFQAAGVAGKLVLEKLKEWER